MRFVVLFSFLVAALLILPTCGGGGGSDGGGGGGVLEVTAVTPDSGREMGGTPLTLTGVGFSGAGTNVVTVGGIVATQVVAHDDNHITCTTGALPLGVLDVMVANSNGSASLPAAFTCTPSWPGAEVKVNEDAVPGWRADGPVLSCEGKTVYAVWHDQRDGKNDIYFNRSHDGGATWRNVDTRLDSGIPGEYRSRYPQMCSDGSAVYVVWYDERNGDRDLYFNRSLDAGQSWLPSDVRLDTDDPGSADSNTPAICCDGARVYVAWADRRRGVEDIYFNRSLDGGLTWLAQDIRVDTAPGAPTGAYLPQIACDADRVFLAWQDMRDGEGDIYFSRSTDAGAIWLEDDVRLDTTPPGSSNSYRPRMAQQGDGLYVVWCDRRFEGDDHESIICMNRSADAGVTWLPADLRIDTTLPAGSFSANGVAVAVDGANVYVVWHDDRNDPGKKEKDVFLNRSVDGGTTWQASDTRLDRSLPGESGSFYPQICCGQGHVFVAWEDRRDVLVGSTLYSNGSSDAGVTWGVDDFRLDSRPLESGGTSEQWALVCDQGSLYVAWSDDRDGDRDVWLRASQP